jgi:hypothetical protein
MLGERRGQAPRSSLMELAAIGGGHSAAGELREQVLGQ